MVQPSGSLQGTDRWPLLGFEGRGHLERKPCSGGGTDLAPEPWPLCSQAVCPQPRSPDTLCPGSSCVQSGGCGQGGLEKGETRSHCNMTATSGLKYSPVTAGGAGRGVKS